MYYDSQKSIREYYNKIKDKYPDLSFEEINAICRTPFIFMGEKMKSPFNELPIFQLKHIGKFLIYANTLKKRIDKCENDFRRGFIPEEQFNLEKSQLIELINKVIKYHNSQRRGDNKKSYIEYEDYDKNKLDPDEMEGHNIEEH